MAAAHVNGGRYVVHDLPGIPPVGLEQEWHLMQPALTPHRVVKDPFRAAMGEIPGEVAGEAGTVVGGGPGAGRRAGFGREIEVLVDAVDEEGTIARSASDAPEIDGLVFIDEFFDAEPGDFLRVKVVDADEHDLYAEIAEKQ